MSPKPLPYFYARCIDIVEEVLKMTIYFTSDQHFMHKNILDFEDRPFKTLEDMQEGLIEAHNSVVNKTDQVFILGDFCFGKANQWVELLNKLRGRLILIKGNHDKSKIINRVLREGYLEEVHEVGTMLRADGFTLNLTHYPMDIGNRPRNFSISGHIHSQPNRLINQVNIGVDSPLAELINHRNDTPFGTPIHLDDILSHLHQINPLVEEQFLKEREQRS